MAAGRVRPEPDRPARRRLAQGLHRGHGREEAPDLLHLLTRLEDESGPLSPFVAERLLRFARCAAAVGHMRGKNYLSVGGVSMGIIGSDVLRNQLLHYLGMGTVFVDMVALKAAWTRASTTTPNSNAPSAS